MHPVWEYESCEPSLLWFWYLVSKIPMFFFSPTFFFSSFIYLLAALGLRCCAWAFSSCDERGYSSLQCAGSSLRWLLLLWSMGLVASWHVGSSRTRARTRVPCIGRRILPNFLFWKISHLQKGCKYSLASPHVTSTQIHQLFLFCPACIHSLSLIYNNMLFEMLLFFNFYFILEYSWFTMLC